MAFQIAIIGVGRIGRVLGKTFEKKGKAVGFWDKDREKVPDQRDLNQIVPSADFLFLCVPSNATREVCQAIHDVLDLRTMVISVSKGIERNTLKTTDQVLEEVLVPNQPFAILGGPLMAEELERGKRGVGVAGCLSQEVGEKVTELFHGTPIIIERSFDVHGVALGGVLKNVYGLMLGIADGMEWGNNTKGRLVAKAMKEIGEITRILGGEEKSAWSVAGLGDLIATGFSPHSRNRRFAEEMVRAGTCDVECEGSISLPLLMELLGEKSKRFPVLLAVYKILFEHKEPCLLLDD